MLVIRLTRTGRVHSPHYRIVVQEKRSKLDGKAVDIIGHYHPAQTDKLLVIDKEKATKWLSQGAQPSATVTNLLVKDKILDASRKVHNFFQPKKQEEVKKAVEETKPNSTTPEVAAEEVEEKAEPEAAADEVAEVKTEATKDELKDTEVEAKATAKEEEVEAVANDEVESGK